MYRTRPLVYAVALGAAAVLTVTPSASADPTPSAPIVSGLTGPLQIDIGHKGQIYVSQSGENESKLTKVRPDGSTKDLVTVSDLDLSGVASRGYAVAFTTTNFDEQNRAAWLQLRKPNGVVKNVADIWAYEKAHNPDKKNLYGFTDLSADCKSQIPPGIPGGADGPYHGILDAHPYALANAPDGGWYVADAGMNAILHVTATGAIHTVAVMRPQKSVITQEAADAVGLPDCVVGHTYRFEPVPTDVEVNARGFLFVTLLPGGPEDPALGARGSAWRVNADTGRQLKIAGGLAGATNIALAPHARMYVAELFGGEISRVRWHNQVNHLVSLPNPASVEYANGKLYVSYDVFGDGKIATVNV